MNKNYLKSAAMALVGYSSLLGNYSQAQSSVSRAGDAIAAQNLESKITVQPIRSAISVDPANNSWDSFGVHDVKTARVYSGAKNLNVKVEVVLNEKEQVHDILHNNKQIEAYLRITPTREQISPSDESSLELKLNKSILGKSARGGYVALGTYALAAEVPPALVAGAAFTLADYANDRFTNRKLYSSELMNLPTSITRDNTRIVREGMFNGDYVALVINIGPKFNPTKYDIKQVGNSFEIRSNDKVIENNALLLLYGALTGEAYKLAKPASKAVGLLGNDGNGGTSFK